MQVLVVGGAGFIGASVAAALQAAGHRVWRGVRPNRPLRADERALDIVHSSDEVMRAALHGIDVVVNASGILRETPSQSFAQVHVEGPSRLARLCLELGVRRFVQISALGDSRDGEFLASKHAFDDALLAMPIASVVLRPSIVYSPAGSYGGTSLLRALAGFPMFQWLPGDGHWPLTPVAMDDLARCVVAAVDSSATGLYEVGAEPPLTLRGYQQHWRDWLRIRGRGVFAVPQALVAAQVRVSEVTGKGPVGETMWRMLKRGNVVAPGSAARLEQVFGVRPRPLPEVLATQPAQVQDRWQAQLYFLGPALRGLIVAVWLLSAWAGFRTPESAIHALADGPVVVGWPLVAMARAGAVIDLLLALWLATGWRPRTALAWMALSVIAYTLVLGSAVPGLWLDPLGGLAKNLLVLPALATAWILEDRR